MFEKTLLRSVAALVAVTLLVGPASAATITHGGVTITMDFVSVGNPWNDGELSGAGAGGYGPDAIVGAVDYSYNIGKYEVTENQWDTVSGIAGDLLDDPGRWSGDQPVASISWYEAAMFCNWLTSGDVTDGAYTVNTSGVVTEIDRDSAISAHGTVYVIPTENEWYKAAYYDGGTSTYYNYPTGSDSVPDGIDSSTDIEFDAVFRDGYDQGHPNDVDIAGVLSPYGTMGQGGNVWEWNETVIAGSSRGFRGGLWVYTSFDLHASGRYYDYPSDEDGYLGFRVASVPEPGSITLLVCGAVGLLAYVWRQRRTA
jgi:sulfatase modifying factor 1